MNAVIDPPDMSPVSSPTLFNNWIPSNVAINTKTELRNWTLNGTDSFLINRISKKHISV